MHPPEPIGADGRPDSAGAQKHKADRSERPALFNRDRVKLATGGSGQSAIGVVVIIGLRLGSGQIGIAVADLFAHGCRADGLVGSVTLCRRGTLNRGAPKQSQTEKYRDSLFHF